jgi:hypothetical protein
MIVQKHEHILTMQYLDGKWVMACVHHECEYKEEIKPAKSWEDEL